MKRFIVTSGRSGMAVVGFVLAAVLLLTLIRWGAAQGGGAWDIFLPLLSNGAPPSPTIPATTRVSLASDGTEVQGYSEYAAISGDGRYVAFYSPADELVPDDTNEKFDVFVHDRETGQTTRVSVASDGTQGNNHSTFPAISADGRFVSFWSEASNLVPSDTNNAADIFVHDRQTGETSRVSVASDGTEADAQSSRYTALSADGRYVAFESVAGNLVPGDTNYAQDIFVHDRQTGETSRVSVASDGAQAAGAYPSISADGRYVAFESLSANLVPGDTNGSKDIFVHDRQTGETSRVSVASDGTEGDDDSSVASISADGRYVAFVSQASNLVPGDTNMTEDVFVHDRETGQTTRVSVASDGTQAYSAKDRPVISADGRYVAFASYANNLVPEDFNARKDIFLHDRLTGTTRRVSVSSAGAQGNEDSGSPAISADGRYVAFHSASSNLVPGDTNKNADVFVHDLQVEPWPIPTPPPAGTTGRVSMAYDGAQSNEHAGQPAISADGRYVAFHSAASNLVPNDTNGKYDIFVYDRQLGEIGRVSVTSDGAQAEGTSSNPAISADGRYVAFESDALNLLPDGYASDLAGGGPHGGVPQVYIHDRVTGQTSIVSVGPGGVPGYATSRRPAISADGRYVAFDSAASNLVPDDTNGLDDIFVHDRVTGETSLVSLTWQGTQGSSHSWRPAISADGRYVAFESAANNLVPDDTNSHPDIFVHDRQTGQTSRVSVASDGTEGNGPAWHRPAISGDGRYIAFYSEADNLVLGDTNAYGDIFVHDQQTGQTKRISIATDGTQGNHQSEAPAISADGRYVSFWSIGELVPGDTNGISDVYLHDRQTGQTQRVSVVTGGAQGDSYSEFSALSADGRYVAFDSAATLVADDTNGFWDIYVHDQEGD